MVEEECGGEEEECGGGEEEKDVEVGEDTIASCFVEFGSGRLQMPQV